VVITYDIVASAPTLTSPTATGIADTAATLGANITSNGGASLTANGICWALSASPVANCVDQGSHATGVFTQSRTGLTEGSLIYYRGYATNSVGTSYSADGTIYTEPTQPTTLSFTSVGSAGITVNWAIASAGNADNVIVVMRSGSAVNADPVDGTTYNAIAAFGSGTQIDTGNWVVYKGTGTSVPVTALSAGTTYYVKVYAYAAGAGGTEISPLAGSQATSAPSGTPYTYTFNYTGSVQSLIIPAGATNIQFSVKGAGGGGGSLDNVGNQQNGQNGHLVATSYSTSGITLNVYVGGGGAAGSTTSSGAGGGWGYRPGGNGGNGEDDGYCWAFGGAGGGGSSAILLGTTVIAESAGGAGGRSSDWEGDCYTYGGSGGTAGGSDYPGSGPANGGTGGASGWPPTPGENGQVIITYD
jgi:hypothetical protein